MLSYYVSPIQDCPQQVLRNLIPKFLELSTLTLAIHLMLLFPSHNISYPNN